MNPTKLKLRNTFLLFFISLGALTFLRMLLYFSQAQYFGVLSRSEIWSSFLMGVRVDSVVLSFAFIPVALLSFLPFAWNYHKKFQKLFFTYWYVITGILVLFICGDIVYFDYVKRHVSGEMMVMGDDLHVLFDMFVVHFEKFLYYIFGMLALFVAMKKVYRYSELSCGPSVLSVGIYLFVIVLTLFMIRSNISGKPLGISDTFTSNKVQSGNLALNGVFTLIKTASHHSKEYHFYPDDEALSRVKGLLSSDTSVFTDPKYPISRKTLDINKTKYNVVIIMLESWSAKYIDSFAGTDFKATPYFDSLARDGLMFTNFFANGQRSIDGLTAMLTGTPKLPGFEYLGHGLELHPMSYLGNIAQENGYETLFMQSSKRGSFRIDSIAKIAGFEHYYGSEDIPELGLEEGGAKPKFGTWDNNMLLSFGENITQLKEPFLSFAFTSSTHAPFVSPGKKWEIYPHDTNNIFGFFNTLKYSDEALENFMNYAKKQVWFERTLFVFTADHTLGFGDDSQLVDGLGIEIHDRELESLRIPLIVYAPKIFAEHQELDTLGSQADLLPTLISLLGLKGSFSSLSHSLFDRSSSKFVLFSYGDILGYKVNSGHITHTLEKEIHNSASKEATKDLLSFYQVFSKLLKENKLKEDEN